MMEQVNIYVSVSLYVHIYCSFICSVATKTPLMGGLTGSYLISTMIGENSVKLIPLLDTDNIL